MKTPVKFSVNSQGKVTSSICANCFVWFESINYRLMKPLKKRLPCRNESGVPCIDPHAPVN